MCFSLRKTRHLCILSRKYKAETGPKRYQRLQVQGLRIFCRERCSASRFHMPRLQAPCVRLRAGKLKFCGFVCRFASPYIWCRACRGFSPLYACIKISGSGNIARILKSGWGIFLYENLFTRGKGKK